MKLLITGSHGMLGTALIAACENNGWETSRLVRSSSPGTGEISWDPIGGTIDAAKLEGFDAVVHLAGESIAQGRWTAAKKDRIRDSRVNDTRLLAATLGGLTSPPAVLITASAIGFYGDRGDEQLTEDSPHGSGYLPDVCRDWEAAAQPAREKGIRVVSIRFGMILATEGGALGKMLFPFKMCVGGRVGSGEQYYSWIGIGDAVAAVQHAIATESLTGPVNGVTPNPVTNFDFTKALGKALSRPTVFPMPAFAARLAFGQMADGLLLASARVVPQKLMQSGFEFQHPELDGCLRHLLGKS